MNTDENVWTNYSARFLPRFIETTSNNETDGKFLEFVGNDAKYQYIEHYFVIDTRYERSVEGCYRIHNAHQSGNAQNN